MAKLTGVGPLPACPAGEAGRQRAACELLHLPGKPAGVERYDQNTDLAAELLHLPGKPAGVGFQPALPS